MSIFFHLLITGSLVSASMFDEPISYFEQEAAAEVKKPIKNKKKKGTFSKNKKFSWKSYLDENNDEFFREGDYLPPKPFLETLRRPTARNILLFEKWKKKKNRLLLRYNKNRLRVLGLGIKEPKENEEVYEKLKGYRMVLYFDSKCPSCKGMFSEINKMVDNGVYVEAVRLDKGKNAVRGLRIPWSQASVKEVSSLRISAVPMLMVFSEKDKRAFKIVGKKSAEEIWSILEKNKKS